MTVSRGRPQVRDHPRSRGVYRRFGLRRQVSAGSSPLARGLPAPVRRAAGGGRIIPARAGFTDIVKAASTEAEDHPRSRGVYTAEELSIMAGLGSSPLARGLPGTASWCWVPRRIIPARAGFTESLAALRAQVEDHPRSRGVYSGIRLRTASMTGSSPLARGLPNPLATFKRGMRIIPARAGFTPWRDRARGPPWDHPRSRGVYCTITGASCPEAGSSPLARGLPQMSMDIDDSYRIIPARAGFTAT